MIKIEIDKKEYNNKTILLKFLLSYALYKAEPFSRHQFLDFFLYPYGYDFISKKDYKFICKIKQKYSIFGKNKFEKTVFETFDFAIRNKLIEKNKKEEWFYDNDRYILCKNFDKDKINFICECVED